MNIFFMIMVAMYILSLGVNLAKHGEEREVKWNFWAALISGAIELTLTYFAIKTGF